MSFVQPRAATLSRRTAPVLRLQSLVAVISGFQSLVAVVLTMDLFNIAPKGW